MNRNLEFWRWSVRTASVAASLVWCGIVLAGGQEATIAVQLEEGGPNIRLSQDGEMVSVGRDVRLGVNEVAQGIVVVVGDVLVEGKVEGDVVVVGGAATIKGEVTGSVVSTMGSVVLGPGAKIEGDLVVVGGGVKESAGAVILGEKHVYGLGFSAPNFKWLFSWLGKGPMMGRWLSIEPGWPWGAAAVFFFLYLVLGVLFSKPSGTCVDVLSRRPLGSFFAGILLFLLMAPTIFVLTISVAGILVIPFLICAFIATVLFGKMSALRFLGEQLGRQTGIGLLGNPLMALLVGSLLALGVYTIPVIGMIAWGLLTPLGAGAVVLAVMELANRPNPALAAASSPISSLGLSSPAHVTPPNDPSDPLRGESAASAPSPDTSVLDALALPRVGFWRRFCASFLDLILVTVAGIILGHPFAFVVTLILYHIVMLGWRGTTIGGAIMGIKCYRINGAPLDYGVAAVRGFSAIFSFVVLGLGFFWAGWDRYNQSWHDKIAGTIVVRMPPGTSLL